MQLHPNRLRAGCDSSLPSVSSPSWMTIRPQSCWDYIQKHSSDSPAEVRFPHIASAGFGATVSRNSTLGCGRGYNQRANLPA